MLEPVILTENDAEDGAITMFLPLADGDWEPDRNHIDVAIRNHCERWGLETYAVVDYQSGAYHKYTSGWQRGVMAVVVVR